MSNERTLAKKPLSEAEWIVQMTVTGYSAPVAQKRVQQVQNGQSLTFVRWTGSLNIAYQVVAKGGQVHDADNVTYPYDREFQPNQTPPTIRIPGLPSPKPTEVVPRTPEDVMQLLIKEVVRQVAANLGNTVQPVEAQVAGGQDNLDRAADFLEKRLWARAIEELEKTPEFGKPEDESYRQYDLGLAYEAMSYNSKSYNEQRANLFKAQEHYDKAAELNRDQRYFVDVIARTRDSVARYRALDAMEKSDRQAGAAGGRRRRPPLPFRIRPRRPASRSLSGTCSRCSRPGCTAGADPRSSFETHLRRSTSRTRTR